MANDASEYLPTPAPSLDRLPPHDTDAEAGALGCVLRAANGEAETCLDQLQLEHFYDLRHQAAFRGLRCLRIDGKALDVVSLHQWLRDKHQGGEAGGLEYVAALPDKTPSAANFPAFLDAIESARVRRAVIQDALDLITKAEDTAIPRAVVQDAARRMATAYSPQRAALAMVDASVFSAAPIPKPPELIAGMLHCGSKLVLGGGSKSFKTWTLLDVALSVSHGRQWLGRDTAAGRVLYCNFEIQDWSWQSRLNAVAAAKAIEIEPGRLVLSNLRGKAANFNLLLPQIADAIKQDFALVILDPIYKLYGHTDENKAGDVAALLNAVEDLAVESGAAVAFGAHFSKGNQATKESIDRISGSGVFARDPDSLLVFTRHEEQDAFTVEATLRDFPPAPPFVVRWTYPLMVADDSLDPSKLKQAGGRKREHTEGELLAILPPGGLITTAWQEAAATEGISRSTFYRLKRSLETAGRVLQSKANDKWQPIIRQVPK